MAEAKPPVVHQITVTLPGGGAATVRHTGDVAPKINMSDGAGTPGAFAPIQWIYRPESPFVQFDRISAAIRQRLGVTFL